MSPSEGPPLLRLRGVVKRFGGATALAGVDFEVRAGEVHALLGANGAGKSTLLRILCGWFPPDAGALEWEGRPVAFAGPADARARGIALIPQEPTLAPHLSVAENVVLGRWPRGRLGQVDWTAVEREAGAVLRRLGVELPARRPVGELGVAAQQLVAIARALYGRARLLVMDEPTSALTPAEVERLFRAARELRAAGAGVVFVTHRLGEALELADRVTVLRDGRVALQRPVGGLGVDELVAALAGPAAAAGEVAPPPAPGPEAPVLLELEGLRAAGGLGPLSLRVRAGEIVGLAGLVGAGRSELARAAVGADPRAGGVVRVAGRPVAPSPAAALAAGLVYLPEDRARQSLLHGRPLRENVAAASWPRLARRGLLAPAAERALAEAACARYRIVPPRPELPIGAFSGGNQQKAVLARLLETRPRVAILDEPTRGVDVGARRELHRLVVELAASGSAVVLISSEFEELVALCHRLVVIRGGRATAEFARAEALAEPRRVLAAMHAAPAAGGVRG